MTDLRFQEKTLPSLEGKSLRTQRSTSARLEDWNDMRPRYCMMMISSVDDSIKSRTLLATALEALESRCSWNGR
jgi:hypothetical protein